jgi:integrase/recombinase XerD
MLGSVMDDGQVDGMRQRGLVVRRVVVPPAGAASWTVIGGDRRPVAPVEAFLRWLTDIERSPNTVRAYAGDLRQFWEFLQLRGYDWSDLGLEELGDFSAWLRSPAENVVVLAGGDGARQAATVNRKLAAVAAFYDFHYRQSAVPVAERLGAPAHRSGRGSFKPMLQGFAPLRRRGRPGRLPERRRLPQVLSLSQVEAILRAQRRLRDRLLFALLFQTGMRIGQALGLRHEDVVTWENRIEIVCRDDNANGARAKGGEGSVPVSVALMRLYAEYMHVEYCSLDSDYVFVNLWGGRVGRPLTYATVNDLVLATRRTVGFHFTPHFFRHTYATLNRRAGVPLEVISQLITHRSVQTTQQTYTHLDVEDLRDELRRAGALGVVEDLV